MKLKSFHKTEGHNTPKNTSATHFAGRNGNRHNRPARSSHRAQVAFAAAEDTRRTEKVGTTRNAQADPAALRQARRAALYQRRARQLFFYKVFAILLLLVAGVFLATRFHLPVGMTASLQETAPQTASADLDSSLMTTDSAGSIAEASPSSAAASTTSDVCDLSGSTVTARSSAMDYDSFLNTALLKYAYLSDLSDSSVYQVTGDVTRSEVAASFFTGFTPVETKQTVRIPENKTPSDAVGTGSTRQGSDDNYDDISDSASSAVSSVEEVFLDSESAVLINLDTGEIVAERNADRQVYPASMTKVLSMLCAEEQITDRTGTFTITRDITDLTFSESLSSVCWDVGEKVTLPDLEYGTILHSGADAAIGLARYSVGSEDALVTLMNERVLAMGLSDKTHFTNVTGQFDENQTVTVTDMAMIMKAAVENERMLEVMRTGEYRTTSTPEHPDGVYIFNKFLDRTQNTEMSGEVVCVKTGYTIESLNCAASYYVSASGAHYVCVTAFGNGSRRVVTDHVNLYETYAK